MAVKKSFALVSLLCVFLFASCLKKSESMEYAKIKVGFIYSGFVHDRGDTQSQEKARIALDKLNVKTMYAENVPADDRCIETAETLISLGCKIIYAADESFSACINDVAKKYPDIKFLVCNSSKTAFNVASYSGRMYEVRYLSGIVAGLKTNTNKIGYLVPTRNCECLRGLNAFALGVQSVNPDAVIEVKYSGVSNNFAVERNFAEVLIESGCDVIAQHRNSSACWEIANENKIFCIGFNQPLTNEISTSYLTSCMFNWGKFAAKDIDRYVQEKWEGKKYWEGIDSGLVELASLSKNCAPGTERMVEDAKFRIENKMLNIFQGPIYDIDGKIAVNEGSSLSDDEIWNMNWIVKGVVEK